MERGIQTVSHYTAGDDADQIASLIKLAAAQAEIVLVTGGLGPTPDDLTRQALADVLQSELVLHAESLARMQEYFRRRGCEMAPANRIQVMIPKGALPLDNEIGTAPGLIANIESATVVCMPGVPAEMRAMFDSSVTPALPQSDVSIAVRVLRVYGLGESNLSEKINDILIKRQGNVIVGTTVADSLISLTINASASSDPEAQALADNTAEELTARLGDMIIGTDSETLASAVGGLLAGRKQTLALAESCTGGLVGQMITSVGGASEYFPGGVVSYSNAVKRDLLGVRTETLDEVGAVSEAVAIEMAQGVRRQLASDWAISLTGIAGPGGGTPEKPVGLVFIGLVGPDIEKVFRHVLASDREQIRRRAAMAALNHLRLALIADK
jgi:nicotinamide-nucleotide amidase